MTATLYGLARIGRIGRGLITGMPVNSRAEALEKLNWYAMRWKIEALHKNVNWGAGQKIGGHDPRFMTRRRCQKFCVLRWVKKSHLMAQVNRSPNRIAN